MVLTELGSGLILVDPGTRLVPVDYGSKPVLCGTQTVALDPRSTLDSVHVNRFVCLLIQTGQAV